MKALGVLTLLIIVSANVDAQTPVSGTFQAASLQATGNSHFHADLIGLFVEDRASGDPTAGPSFQLRASQLRVERDTVQTAIAVDGGQPTWTGPAQFVETYIDTQLTGTANRIGYRLNLQGGTAYIESGCLDLRPSSAGRIQRNPILQTDANRAPLIYETTDSVATSDCSSDAVLVVRGDLVASLWQWDATFQDGATLRTGYLSEPTAPEASPATVYAGPAQEAFLYATGAELRIPLTLASTYEIYVQGAGLDASGRLTLHDGQAELDALGALPRSSRIALHGDSHLTLRGGGHLTGTYAGVLDGIEIEGEPLSVATESEAPSFMMLVGAISALALAAWLLLRRHGSEPNQLYEQAFRAHVNRQNRRALRLIGRAIGRHDGDGSMWELRARCHYALGHYGRAVAAYRIAYSRFPTDSPQRQIVHGRLAALDPTWNAGAASRT